MYDSSNLLEVRDLKKHFVIGTSWNRDRRQVLRAVDGVDLTIRRGETLGVVGESGCGKSTLGRCVLGLIPPSGGEVRFEGRDVGSLKSAKERLAVKRRMQIVFQDPYSSLNPRMRVGDVIAEGLIIHDLCKGGREEKVRELLAIVGLRPEHAQRFPHEFSGGQRQRIGIARALAVSPDFIVADEAVSALDVSIQAQILNLLRELQAERGLSFMFISHDLRAVSHISDRVAVMYLGKVVEVATREELYADPRHPYTRALLSAVPLPQVGRKRESVSITGEIPSPINPPKGCHFHPRCPFRKPVCSEISPALTPNGAGHRTACHVFH